MTNRAGADRSRSIQDLEGDDWGDPPPGATFLIRRVHELRRVPIDELDVEGLRMLIGQRVGVDLILPRVVDVLVDHPMAEGDFYPGDLLEGVLRLGPDEWATRPDLLTRLLAALEDVEPGPGDDEEIVERIVRFRDEHRNARG